MKKRFTALFLLLALLTLSACGGSLSDSGTATPLSQQEPDEVPETDTLPALTPLEELSADAVVTEGRVPAEAYELPQRISSNPIAEDSFPALLAELPEASAAFYGLRWDTGLIRWGESLAEFDWDWLTPRQILPRLYCLDFDGDREDELIVVCYTGSGTGIAYEEMHVLEKSPEGTLTDYALPREMFTEELSKALSVVTVNDRTYSILGTELVDITDLLPEPEDADPANIEGLGAGDIVFFEATPDSHSGWPFRYEGAAWLAGEGFPATACYVANLSAIVAYKDGVFTLTDLQLS